MNVFTNEELEFLKIFYDKGAKWASRDIFPLARIDFWPTKPTKNCIGMYVADNLMFMANADFIPSMKADDLLDLDAIFNENINISSKKKDILDMFKPDYTSFSEDLSCCCCDGALSALHTESADYYRGRYDGLAEYIDKLRKEDADGGD